LKDHREQETHVVDNLHQPYRSTREKYKRVKNEFEKVNFPLLGSNIYNNFGYIKYIV